jgi:spermidine synthase
MKPWETLDMAPAPGGGALVLARRGEEYAIRVGGHVLMTSRTHGSEEALAEHGCAPLADRARPRVLIGGLGMGYTVRAALERLGPGASVTVAELVPAVVRWNRGTLAPLAGRPLEDPRVSVVEADVGAVLREAAAKPFDAVLLDVDNGPAALTRPENARLYGGGGLALAHGALKPGGVLIVWSAAPDAAFTRRFREAGFEVQEVETPARGKSGGARHVLFVGRRARG